MKSTRSDDIDQSGRIDRFREYYENLGCLVRIKRAQMGLEQDEFADLCEVSRSTICDLENAKKGRSYRLDTIFLISDKINMTPSEMLAFEIPEGKNKKTE